MYKLIIVLTFLSLQADVLYSSCGIGTCCYSKDHPDETVVTYRDNDMLVCSADRCIIYRYSELQTAYGDMFREYNEETCEDSFESPPMPSLPDHPPENDPSAGRPHWKGDHPGRGRDKHRGRRAVCSLGSDGDFCCPTQLDVLWFDDSERYQTSVYNTYCSIVDFPFNGKNWTQSAVVGSCQYTDGSCALSGSCHLNRDRYVFLVARCPASSPVISVHLFKFDSHCICINSSG